MRKLFVIILLLFWFMPIVSLASNSFFKLGLMRISTTAVSDSTTLAKYDVIVFNRYHYNDINGDTFGTIKALNPGIELYVYYKVNLSDQSDDCTSYANRTIARYDGNFCSHSQGDILNSNPTFILKDSGNNIVNLNYPGESDQVWMNFGDATTNGYQDYAAEAMIYDHSAAMWDDLSGVYSDQCFVVEGGTSATPALYNTPTKWITGMNSMMGAMTAALSAEDKYFIGNRGPIEVVSTYEAAAAAWISQDQSANPMHMAFLEGGVVQPFGGAAQFKAETIWKSTIDTMRDMDNTIFWLRAGVQHTSLSDSELDNYGVSITGYEALYFALGSYLLAKHDDKTYFLFTYAASGGAYGNDSAYYYDEYDEIDLGDPVGEYDYGTLGGTTIYYREYDRGYVYVNPGTSNSASFTLSQSCKNITHATLATYTTDSSITTLQLDAHRGAILYKTSSLTSNKPNKLTNVTISNATLGPGGQ